MKRVRESRKRKQAKFAGVPFSLVHKSHVSAKSWRHKPRKVDVGRELLERTKVWDADEFNKLNQREEGIK